MSLKLETLQHLLWLANRRSRGKTKAARSGFSDETERLEKSIMNEMRPILPAILRAAIRDTERKR